MRDEQGANFDVLVFGGGSAGYAAARVAGELGAKVGLVERGPIGGLCILDGCIPSKALLRPADVLRLARDGVEMGVRVAGEGLDFARVMARKRELVAEFAADRRQEIADAKGVTLLMGSARFVGRREIALRPATPGDAVAAPKGAAGAAPAAIPADARAAASTGEAAGVERAISARKVVVTSGSYAWLPPIPGIEDAGYITSDEALDLDAPPRSLIVLGAGAIALELGQFYARAGSQVTLMDRDDQILGEADPDVADALAGYLRAEGIIVHTGVKITSCSRRPDGRRVVVAEVAGERREILGDALLVAVGRKAAVGGLDLGAAGVAVDEEHGAIVVDETMRSSNPDVYAAGDVTSRRQATHLAVQQGEIAGYNAAHSMAMERGDRTLGASADRPLAVPSPQAQRLRGVASASADDTLRLDDSLVPLVLYTDPALAQVGMCEHEAREASEDYVAARYDFAELGMARVVGQTKGCVKVLARRRDGRILGVQVLGFQADTLIHEAVVAMAFGATAEE